MLRYTFFLVCEKIVRNDPQRELSIFDVVHELMGGQSEIGRTFNQV